MARKLKGAADVAVVKRVLLAVAKLAGEQAKAHRKEEKQSAEDRRYGDALKHRGTAENLSDNTGAWLGGLYEKLTGFDAYQITSDFEYEVQRADSKTR